MAIWITLTLEQIEFADTVGRRRHDAAIATGRIPGNNAVRALWMDTLGARCEAAGKIFLNPIKWNALAENPRGLADLSDWIDVKGVEKHRHRLIVQRDDPDAWAYLLISAECHPDYYVIGWCYGSEAKQSQFWTDPVGDRAAYFVPATATFIKHPRLLREKVHPSPVDDVDEDDWADLLARMGDGPVAVRPVENQKQSLEDVKKPVHGRTPFLHYCHCGEWGAFGFGVDTRNGKEGNWFCREHRP